MSVDERNQGEHRKVFMLKPLFAENMVSFSVVLMFALSSLQAQERSFAPEINKAFLKPDVADFLSKFEKEGREAFEHRDAIVAACNIREGMDIADVGAGTGLFSRLFSTKVGNRGTVFAVDISEDFLKHIHETAREQNLVNIQTVLCKQDSVELPDASVDIVFTCDTYHHFEFPFKTLHSIHRALKPGGRIIVVDYHRIEGKSTEWVMGHVRAGLDVVQKEITSSGFKLVGELEDVLSENYMVEFEKVAEANP